MKVISLAVIAFIVSVVLSYVSGRASESDTRSLDHFTMRPAREISYIGWIGAAFFLFCIIGSSIAHQFKGFLVVIFGGLFLLGVFLILVPVKGVWEVTVSGDEVTRCIVWIFRKTFRISDIDHCVLNKGGYKVYVRGRRGKAFGIDSYFINTENWEKRMEKEGIEIRIPQQ